MLNPNSSWTATVEPVSLFSYVSSLSKCFTTFYALYAYQMLTCQVSFIPLRISKYFDKKEINYIKKIIIFENILSLFGIIPPSHLKHWSHLKQQPFFVRINFITLKESNFIFIMFLSTETWYPMFIFGAFFSFLFIFFCSRSCVK